jgi:hypothetical protein
MNFKEAHMKSVIVFLAGTALTMAAVAKLPAPSDEAKAKAAEAAAKTAHAGKVDAYQLCKSQDKVAAHYQKGSKTGGKDKKPAVATPACADPGAFVYVPAAPAATASAPAAPAAQTAAVPAAKDKKKP